MLPEQLFLMADELNKNNLEMTTDFFQCEISQTDENILH